MPTDQACDEYNEDTLYMPNLTFLLKYTVADSCLHNLSNAGTEVPNSCDSKPFQARMVPSLTLCFSVRFVSFSTPGVKVCSRAIQLEDFAVDVSGNGAKLAVYVQCVNCPNKATLTGSFLQPVLRQSLLTTKSFSSHLQVSRLRMEQAIAIAVPSNLRHVC